MIPGRIALLAASLLLALALFAPSGAYAAQPADPWDGNWHYTLSPYAWLPGIRTKLRFNVPGYALDNETSGSIYDYLSAALEISGMARKGRWGVWADFDWVDFSNERGVVNAIPGPAGGRVITFDSTWDLRGGMLHMAGLYTLAHGRHGYADLLFGARYVWIEGKLAWNLAASGSQGAGFARSGSRDGSSSFVTPVVGLAGRWLPFANRVFVNWRFDYGTAAGYTSAEAKLGVGYAFHWGDVALNWRGLRLEQNGSGTLLQRADLYGPSIEMDWHF